MASLYAATVKIVILIPLTIYLAAAAVAQELTSSLWTGTNGKSFQGTFRRLTEEGQKAEFVAPDGKIVRVATANLIPADRERLLTRLKPPSTVKSDHPVDAGGFKFSASPDRRLIPSLDPKDFGGSSGKSMVDALWISLLWWDKTDVLEVPTRGDLKTKARWLHKKLDRLVGGSDGAVTASDAKKGMAKYFSENLKELADCRITLEEKDFSVPRLAGLLHGASAVILEMSMEKTDGYDYSVSAVLEAIHEDGRFTLHVFGKRCSGKIKPIDEANRGIPGSVPSEYVLDNLQDLTDGDPRNEVRFYMGKEPWNAALALKPYVYLTRGKPFPLPLGERPEALGGDLVDTGFIAADFEGDRKLTQKFPIKFATPVEALREWSLTDGRKILGSPVAWNGSLLSLKTANDEQISIERSLLSEDELARAEFWKACEGAPLTIPRLDLSYRFNTSTEGSFEVAISAEGSLGRASFQDQYGSYTMVFDIRDGAFVSTYVHRGATVRIHTGRFLREQMRPLKLAFRYSQKDIDHFLSTVLPRSPESKSTLVPCRWMHYPLAGAGVTFRNPEIDFVLLEQPAALIGLYQLLCRQTPGKGDGQVFVFPPYQVPNNSDGESVFSILATCKVLPVRIAWENLCNERITKEFHRVRGAGKFSIELTRAAVPSTFPKDHFAILPAARAMAAGSMLTKEFLKKP
jgi:hypothetical protein